VLTNYILPGGSFLDEYQAIYSFFPEESFLVSIIF